MEKDLSIEIGKRKMGDVPEIRIIRRVTYDEIAEVIV